MTAARELAAAAARAESVISFQHMQAVFLLRHIKGAIIALEHDQSAASVQRVLEKLQTVHASGCYEMDHMAMPPPNGVSPVNTTYQNPEASRDEAQRKNQP